MLTIEALRAFGANVDEGLGRCLNNEAFYLKMVNIALDNTREVEELSTAVARGDLEAAFNAAHALKGVLGNLSLEPTYSRVVEVTELLRKKQPADYQSYVDEIKLDYAKLQALRE